MNIDYLPLPKELHFNIIKYLRHPIAELFINDKAYNHFLSSKFDTYTNIGGVEFQINELIPFYDVWRIYRHKHKQKFKILKIIYWRTELLNI